MSANTILTIIIVYFLVLLTISWLMSRKDNSNSAFFQANKNAKWYLVAFGMIGTALSGVTFISVPGEVGSPNGEQFKYFQFVLGNAVGFLLTATVLLPLYYRLNLVSIYTYFEKKLGIYSYKSAATIFLLSRTVGSAFRLYLVVIVLQRYVFDAYNIPFAITVILSLLFIFAYTYKAGLKTIIVTDTLQTFFLVSAVVSTIIFICLSLDFSTIEAFESVKQSNYSKIFFFEDFIGNRYHFVKQFLGGVFVTLAMVGLDQDLMQKNLSCANIKDAQKNMFAFTGVFVLINLFFLSVGALLYIYAEKNGIAIPVDELGHARTDYLFPEIAINYMAGVPAVVFVLGIVAATFATTDSALTALTTSFCVDFLGMDKDVKSSEKRKIRTRYAVHLSFAFLMFLVIIVFNSINDKSVVSMIFRIASYTYGPLLGLFIYTLLFKNRQIRDKWIPFICMVSPLITWWIVDNSTLFFGNYVFDNELIILNALITVLLMFCASKKYSGKKSI